MEDKPRTWFDELIVMNTTKELDNLKKDTLVERTKRSNYLTSKLHAQNNPDILYGESCSLFNF